MPLITKTYKSTDESYAAFAFYNALPSTNKPRSVEVHDCLLRYELVEGSYPRTVESVLECAERAMWDLNDDKPQPMNRQAYTNYVMHVAGQPGNCGLHRMNAAVACVLDAKLTPVAYCHGDLTLSNCVHTYDDRIIFLDPGNARGLPCRELDEAKIMQSLDGFDMIRYGWPMRAIKPTDWPRIEVTQVHWALLLTHYVRLIPHMAKIQRDDLVKLALRRIGELDKWLR